MFSGIDSFFTKVSKFFWFTIIPILGFLMLLGAFIASFQPERYPNYNYSQAIIGGIIFLSLPILKNLVLRVSRHDKKPIALEKKVMISTKITKNELDEKRDQTNFQEPNEHIEKIDVTRNENYCEPIIEKHMIISSEVSEDQLKEFNDKFFAENKSLKKSKDIFNYILTYSQLYKQRALDPENLLMFRKLLERQDVIQEYTAQEIEDFIEFDLKKIEREEHEKKLRYGRNLRDSGVL